MIKILNLISQLNTGGGSINTIRASKTSENNHDIAAKITNKYLATDLKNKMEIFDINLSKLSFISLKVLSNVIKKKNYQIIHAQGRGGAVYGLFIKLFFNRKIKIVYTFRGFTKFSGFKLLLNFLFESILSLVNDGYICVSNSEKNEVISFMPWIKPRVVVIANGVIDDEIIAIRGKNSKKKLEDKNLDIVCLTRISPEKNIEFTLDIAAAILKKTCKFTIEIYGESTKKNQKYKTFLENKIKSMGLKKNVFIKPSLKREDALKVLKTKRFYLTTSSREGLPSSLIEAMYLDCIIFATKVRGHIDVVRKNSGILIAVNKEKEAAEKIIKVFNNINEFEYLSKNAHASVLSEYHWKDNAKKLDDYHKGILRNG